MDEDTAAAIESEKNARDITLGDRDPADDIPENGEPF